MKKWMSLLTLASLISTLVLPIQAQAATAISVYMDGNRIATDQAPIEKSGRVLLPLRAIFESLDADVLWNPKTSVVTAVKDDTTIQLKIGSKTATINNKSVALDVPAQTVKGRTLVPVRFVSTALGANVEWKPTTRSVYITNPVELSPVAYVTPQVIGQNGDGRDLKVSFSKVTNESTVSHYRVLVVKTDRSRSFDLQAAQNTAAGKYTYVSTQGTERTVALSAQSRDTDGDLLRSNQSYTVYVLAIGTKAGEAALSNPSPAVTLGASTSVQAVTSVSAQDVNDYGDGRDLSVSFTKASNESNIANYRIFVVKTSEIGSFNTSVASGLTSANYTIVNKTGSSTLTTVLGSSTRDTSGELLRTGVSYTAYVLSVSNSVSAFNHQLSAGSLAVVLSSGFVTPPVITSVTDVSDYNDGRDVRVNFNKVSDESRISEYRVYAVRTSNADSFNLSTASNLSSTYYTTVSKTGYSLSPTLNASSRDTSGSLLTSGVSYRFFVLAVGNGSYYGTNVLSGGSSAFTLYNNINVGYATNVNAWDIADNNDGRDMQVSFNRASDESNISHYRIFVVRDGYADSFNLTAANNFSDYYYTYVSKTGYNITRQLASTTRDVNGNLLQNNVSYRVFVLSVGTGSYAGTNALSSYSPIVTLYNNNGVKAVTGLTGSDVADNGNGLDLRVSFTKASDESSISSYRLFVVKSEKAGYFSRSIAENLTSSSYYTVNKTGYNFNDVLSSSARDSDGELIKNDQNYNLFVLSVGKDNYYGTNILSTASSTVKLITSSTAQAAMITSVTDVADSGNGSDLSVSFNKPSSAANIDHYRIIVVKSEKIVSASQAAALADDRVTFVSKEGNSSNRTLSSDAKDSDGDVIREGQSYKVYVLSKVSGSGTNALSVASGLITLGSPAIAPTNIKAELDPAQDATTSIRVTFNASAKTSNLSEYRIFVVPTVSAFGRAEAENSKNYKQLLSTATETSISVSTDKDYNGNPMAIGSKYKVYVLAVNSIAGKGNAISEPSNEITIKGTVPAPTAPAPTETTPPAPAAEPVAIATFKSDAFNLVF
ncbi:hypothetical protein J2Z69_002558 [Paenibacillus shirakamiensis]|uniref:Copper amine oxidase-like N-terminal domain-containing protein n=1 Tax=Paenibacillus shirakamiensis TaxID=1265935 RepID=A0ABS4JIH9_9BACL|nr:copper amine oxidase N-terminal domain-containing protein [Paenibacillus shirakamiensis]MBP2001513.1 hypothetical protein [Paenibacillus shirakamiensis]